MTPPKERPPDLDHCVQILQSLARDVSTKPPKVVAEIYVAALGLLYNLKLDQVAIQNMRKQNEGSDSIPYPKPSTIPAITAVVHNQELFKSLISCLSASASDIDSFESRQFHMTPGSRKRAPSIDNIPEPPSKSLKISQSPQVAKRSFGYARPQINVRILAATILFIAFEHLDHWPAPLVKAYADDCFGPRSWVDEPSCQLLVKNLALCHGTEGADDEDDVMMGDVDREADALIVAEFYMEEEKEKPVSDVPSQSPMRKRGSLSSLASHTSLSSAPPTAPLLTKPRSSSVDSSASTPPAAPQNEKSSTNNAEDSDSGDEEEVAITNPINKKSDDGDSSSSGEEDEVLLESKSFDGDESVSMSKEDELPPTIKPTYPLNQQHLNFSRIRKRYFGINLDHAHLAISSSLRERLDVKSKQNSGLLQSLPNFTSIPSVRTLITANLEKWLQSPALAGLARGLFSRTVNMMKNVDPPLPADLEAIDNILSMRLKANQLNAHVENVTAIASKIPTSAVAHHVYGHLLREVLLSMDNADLSTSEQLKMVNAIHRVFPSNLNADGIASALLTLLVKPPESLKLLTAERIVKRLMALIRAVARELGNAFDGCRLLQSILSFDVSAKQWTIREEENRARLMFQCATLLSGHQSLGEGNQHGKLMVELRAEDRKAVKGKLVKARKLLLNWCCADYVPLYCSEHQKEKLNGQGKTGGEILGAGPADYSSILDGINVDVFPSWLEVTRSVLFMESSDSRRIRKFLFPDVQSIEGDPEWKDEAVRIDFCCEHGADLDDEMVWIVLRAATMESGGIPAQNALTLLEHLFNGCNKHRKASLSLSDPGLLWELYKLVEYTPPNRADESEQNGTITDDVDIEDTDRVASKIAKKRTNGLKHGSGSTNALGRLAFPGLWWRATGLALIICGCSPKKIGAVAWEDHPTLRALIKMVTSDRYRFPTVDCDDSARDEMKKTEQSMRDEEARITEFLFLPKKQEKAKKKAVSDESTYGGSRMSKRQKEKREKLLKKQQEKEAAEAMKEANRRKKILRVAQKSIMLWDPKRGPRKPPKESADLIFSVGELFDLPRIFQRTTDPDFVLRTIGNTTRGAIERAYDWLIPIISYVPDTISRLPASASCFLLLRAYGTEGEERAQLQELSAPLLVHVRQSLLGKFGLADAVRAFDLLLTDVASHNPDRRRCARRVLHDAIGKEEFGQIDSTFAKSNCAWMVNILHVEHLNSIISDAIEHLVRAASFERGRVLRYLILALDKLTTFALDHSPTRTWEFSSMLIRLISGRPTVFAAAMGSFRDLRSLAIRVVHDSYEKYFSLPPSDDDEIDAACDITLCEPASLEDRGRVKAIVPLSLLQSSCVLLSIWLEVDPNNDDGRRIKRLVKILMRSQEDENKEALGEQETVDGLASAKLANGKSAIPVESWVMLARSRSDFIAKRAALTAPTAFLPRLLLCSGLPRASLLTMIDRLGKLGEKADDKGKCFNQLLVPSAASEWDIGRLGRRREVARKLLGRLSAYSRMFELSKLDSGEMVSFTFLEWLSDSCQTAPKPRKTKSKKDKVVSSILGSLGNAETFLETLSNDLLGNNEISEMQLDGDASDMTRFLEEVESKSDLDGAMPSSRLKDVDHINQFLRISFERNDIKSLEVWLNKHFRNQTHKLARKDRSDEDPRLGGEELSFLLLTIFSELERKTEGLGACIVKWVPKISTTAGSPYFWQVLFAEGQKPTFMWSNLIARCSSTWSRFHVSSCCKWILSQENFSELDVEKIVRFLVLSSSLGSVHVENFAEGIPQQEQGSWSTTEELVKRACSLGIDCLADSEDETLERSLCSRNDLPDGAVLLLLIAGLGRNQLQYICQVVLTKLEEVGEKRPVLILLILRLYAYFPQHMNLGSPSLRSVLKEAVGRYANDWLDWRSPMDDQFQDMINSLVSNYAPQRMVQVLSEGSKKHPLLLLRKLGNIEEILEADATVKDRSSANEARGVIFGVNLSGPIAATIEGKPIQLSVKHWGFNCTEGIWTSFLDVISVVPNEVLFSCGLQMGLLDFLGVYLRLIFVQTQLRTSERLSRLKGKFSDFLEAFKNSNLPGWESWLSHENSGLTSLGGTRNILMSCGFITHQQAIDSVKKKSANPTEGGAATSSGSVVS